MRVHIDALKCAATGFCARISPEVFNLPEGARSVKVKRPVINDDEIEAEVFEAQATCPRQAIIVDSAPI